MTCFTCASLWLSATLWRSSRDWFTVFSSCSATCMASKPVPHSSRSGFCKQTKKKYKMKPLKTLKATNAQFLNVYCNLSFRKHYKGHTYFDVLENDTPSSLILVFHQFFSMFPFFIWWILEELAESWKGHIISIEVVGL